MASSRRDYNQAGGPTDRPTDRPTGSTKRASSLPSQQVIQLASMPSYYSRDNLIVITHEEYETSWPVQSSRHTYRQLARHSLSSGKLAPSRSVSLLVLSQNLLIPQQASPRLVYVSVPTTFPIALLIPLLPRALPLSSFLPSSVPPVACPERASILGHAKLVSCNTLRFSVDSNLFRPADRR